MCRRKYRVDRITGKLPTRYRKSLSAFSKLQKELEEAFQAFTQTKDRDARRLLLAEMRRLLDEADRLNQKDGA